MDRIEFAKFTPESIEEAIEGLDGLQKIIVPFLKSQNYEGRGKSDAVQCKKHLMMGKHALVIMLDALMEVKEAGGMKTDTIIKKTEKWHIVKINRQYRPYDILDGVPDRDGFETPIARQLTKDNAEFILKMATEIRNLKEELREAQKNKFRIILRKN